MKTIIILLIVVCNSLAFNAAGSVAARNAIRQHNNAVVGLAIANDTTLRHPATKEDMTAAIAFFGVVVVGGLIAFVLYRK